MNPPLSSVGMPQQNSITSSPRATSPIASESTLPCSAVSSRASSSRCACEELADAEEELGAPRERERAPGRERRLRGLHGRVDLLDAWRSRPRRSARRSPGCRPARVRPELPATAPTADPVVDRLDRLRRIGQFGHRLLPARHRQRTARSAVGDPVTISPWRPWARTRSSGEQIVEDAKRYVLYSWSVQDAINPIAVAGGEGRYFWDYDGKRYLDFASQLVNVSIGYGHPKVVAAIKEQAETLATIGPPMATESRSTARQAARRGDAGRPLAARSSPTAAPRRTRTRSSSRAGTPAATRSSPATAATTARRRLDHAHRRPAPLARRAGHPRRRAHARPVHLPLPGRPSRSVPGLHRRAAPRGDPDVRGRRRRSPP